MKLKVKDNLHYSFSKVDGYDAVFVMVISEREAGKSTAMVSKMYKAFKSGKISFLFRRLTADITELYIESIANILRKFHDENIELTYNKNSIKEGAVKITIGDKILCYVLSLSAPLSRLKSCMVDNLIYIFFDEYICNTRIGEKYLKNEFFKFSEIYNTYQREMKDGEKLKCYFLGNPYSLYNPYFSGFEVDVKQVKRGEIYKKKGFPVVVESYEITKELKDFILERNPLYKFDNSYKRYAFDGESINDMSIKLYDEIPLYFKLLYGFRIEGVLLGLFFNTKESEGNLFIVKKLTDEHKKLNIYCYDFKELIDRTVLLDINTKRKLEKFKYAFRRRLIEYQDLECYYLCEELFCKI